MVAENYGKTCPIQQLISFFLYGGVFATGWLEPLLDRVARDTKTVTSPVIGLINDETLEVRFHKPWNIQVGGFKWSLTVRFFFFFFFYVPKISHLVNIKAQIKYIELNFK